MPAEFVPGQRWVNQAELQLGLGTIVSVEHRTITLMFQATGETRTYAKDTAPLTRIIFSTGDRIRTREGVEIRIQDVRETVEGLIVYSGIDTKEQTLEIPETRLDGQVALHGPRNRLLAGMVDEDKWFNLRRLTLEALKDISRFPLTGITGCRTDLIPHQLYIANEVGKRYAPRVLLADEVGLGKTIEAGLIIHQQLFTEQIRRVLIVVPENLIHQWLVEMLRRFNLRFSIFDLDRMHGMREGDGHVNPFEQEQLVLCSLSSLVEHGDFLEQALSAQWDLLAVDEAHHLAWSPGRASKAYSVIESLSSRISSVLLLTATPEQLGKDGHFARLRLLDPDRFPDFESFLAKERNYEPVARAVDSLFKATRPPLEVIRELETFLEVPPGSLAHALEHSRDPDGPERTGLIDRLLDHHGTGRVLFRNTRAAIRGFPGRQLHAVPLAAPEHYSNLKEVNDSAPQELLSPELHYERLNHGEHWTRFDPRVNWLIRKLGDLSPEKVLVITHDAGTARELSEVLRTREGIYAAIFHEDMTILERDRAAAYFADAESGTRVLICSEIGSEGRNFQFAHNLILFDLPFNPDLLEQRIGRLDRIGQRHTIHLHIPYLVNTAQEIMFHWYEDGLGAFTSPCRTGQALFDQVEADLVRALKQTKDDARELIARTQTLNEQLLERLEKGRDRLLEYNSCRPGTAAVLHAQAMEADRTSRLPGYMGKIFDCFGVHSEDHPGDSLILSPAEDMVTAFPHLPDEGLTVTFSRKTALIHENWQYLTWCHPMVTGAMDMVSGTENGNATLTSFKDPDFTPGSIFIECYYIIESPLHREPVLRKLVAPQLIRLLIDETGTSHERELSHDVIESTRNSVSKQVAMKIISMKQSSLKKMIEQCNQSAIQLTPQIVDDARKAIDARLKPEITRLQDLKKINPAIRREEIDFFVLHLDRAHRLLDSALPRLDAVRVLVAA